LARRGLKPGPLPEGGPEPNLRAATQTAGGGDMGMKEGLASTLERLDELLDALRA
jgi:hypothetical protein